MNKKVVIDREGYLRGSKIRELANAVANSLKKSSKSIAQLAEELNASEEAIERGIAAARLLLKAPIWRENESGGDDREVPRYFQDDSGGDGSASADTDLGD